MNKSHSLVALALVSGAALVAALLPHSRSAMHAERDLQPPELVEVAKGLLPPDTLDVGPGAREETPVEASSPKGTLLPDETATLGVQIQFADGSPVCAGVAVIVRSMGPNAERGSAPQAAVCRTDDLGGAEAVVPSGTHLLASLGYPVGTKIRNEDTASLASVVGECSVEPIAPGGRTEITIELPPALEILRFNGMIQSRQKGGSPARLVGAL